MIRGFSPNQLNTVILQTIETLNGGWVITELLKHIVNNHHRLDNLVHFNQQSTIHPAEMREATLEPTKSMLNKDSKL